jgi:hypothetical protein
VVAHHARPDLAGLALVDGEFRVVDGVWLWLMKILSGAGLMHGAAPGAPCAGGLGSGGCRFGLRAALALQRQLVALRTEVCSPAR